MRRQPVTWRKWWATRPEFHNNWFRHNPSLPGHLTAAIAKMCVRVATSLDVESVAAQTEHWCDGYDTGYTFGLQDTGRCKTQTNAQWEDPPFYCALPVGHFGPHTNQLGDTWPLAVDEEWNLDPPPLTLVGRWRARRRRAEYGGDDD